MEHLWLFRHIYSRNITATGGAANDRVAFKNCAPFTKCITDISDEHVDNADNLDIIMPLYNLIEYSDNYSDTSGSLWQFKKHESPVTDVGNPDNVSTSNLTSFKYKSSFFKPITTADNGVFKGYLCYKTILSHKVVLDV